MNMGKNSELLFKRSGHETIRNLGLVCKTKTYFCISPRLYEKLSIAYRSASRPALINPLQHF